MGNIADSLVYRALVASGGRSGGGGESGPVSPDQVYRDTRPASWMPMPTPEPDSVYMLIVGADVAYIAFKAATSDGSDLDVSIGTVDASGVYSASESLTAAKSGKLATYAVNLEDSGQDAGEDGKQIMMRIGGLISSFKADQYSEYIEAGAAMIVDVAMCTPHATLINLSNYQTMVYAYVDAYGDSTVDMRECFREPLKTDAASSLVCVRYLRCKPSNLDNAFGSCYRLLAVDMDHIDTSHTTSMRYMFYNCSGLTSLDLSKFDTANVTSMSYMFQACTRLKSLNVSSFDTANVTDMGYMFQGCQSLTAIDVSRFNTSKVTNMSNMFHSCQSLTSLDLSHFNTSKVTLMVYMFSNCHKLKSLDLSSFDTSKVTKMNYMFEDCIALTHIDVSTFDVSSLTRIDDMYRGCKLLRSINMAWANMTAVTRVGALLQGCQNLRSIVLRPDTQGWAGVNLTLLHNPLSVDALSKFIDSLPTITEAHTVSVKYLDITDDITPEMIEAAAAKNWTLDTGAAATLDIEPDIPAEQALAIITGEEV